MTVNFRGPDGPAAITQPPASDRTPRSSSLDEWLCTTLIQKVEETTGIDALDLPPLNDTIDADALEALVRSTDRSLILTFEYAGLAVTIDGDCEISVTRPSE